MYIYLGSASNVESNEGMLVSQCCRQTNRSQDQEIAR